MKKKLLVVALFCSNFIGKTEAQIKPTWTRDFDANLLCQKITPFGDLLISPSGGLLSIDPETGKTQWGLTGMEYNAVGNEDVNIISGTPFLKVHFNDYKFLIVNAITGEILFDNSKTALQQLAKEPLPLFKAKGILLSGFGKHEEDPVLGFVDIATGELKWESREKILNIVAIEDLSEKEILVVTPNDNYKLNAETGKTIWKVANTETSKGLNKMGRFGSMMKQMTAQSDASEILGTHFLKHPEKDLFIVGVIKEFGAGGFSSQGAAPNYSTYFRLYDSKSGEMLWKKPLVLSGEYNNLKFKDNSFIALPSGSRAHKANAYSLETQKGTWAKKGRGVSVKGGVSDYILFDDKILLISDDGTNSFLTYLNYENGNKLLKKPIKIKGHLRGVFPHNNKMLVVTDTKLNIADLSTGEFLLKKGINTNNRLLFKKDEQVYAFDKKEKALKSIDLNSLVVKNFSSEKIEFEGREEPNALEHRNGTFLLSSSQNMLLIDENGKKVYQNYFKAPGQGFLNTALNYTDVFTNTFFTASSFLLSGAVASIQTEKSSLASAYQNDIVGTYLNMGTAQGSELKSSIERARMRHKATKSGSDFSFILTRENKSNYLMKVQKNTGAVVSKIDLGKDKEPQYTVDFYTNRIFYEDHKQGGILSSYE